ncbi:hypothetical protein D1816_21080 [Aquimarina sp. AD10]|uniref:hypothetical protein n=1 Tax=Aquimarina sp. AD10 TaxID=1714849 RepID=UPI000E47FF0D|nr:hypothetical protein [Aquimarina sp. AD10]AXT62729.1 hypothetical protein D1816_21080 [Aquimarina sp. AD10]RKN01912.1 hypothetical protein D7033_02445 [Aquimarina sp. AD10]
MDIGTIRLLFDFGLLILIWHVQILIYPSFSYYKAEGLRQWHKKYVLRITYIVMPLMIGQLSLAIVQSFHKLGSYEIGSLTIISIIWLSTFLQFVPMHSKISFGDTDHQMLSTLIRKNWLRTVLLSIMFTWSFIHLCLQ